MPPYNHDGSFQDNRRTALPPSLDHNVVRIVYNYFLWASFQIWFVPQHVTTQIIARASLKFGLSLDSVSVASLSSAEHLCSDYRVLPFDHLDHHLTTTRANAREACAEKASRAFCMCFQFVHNQRKSAWNRGFSLAVWELRPGRPLVRIQSGAPRRNGLCSIQKAQPKGWAFLMPLRHSSSSPQIFAGAPQKQALYRFRPFCAKPPRLFFGSCAPREKML